MPSTVPTNTAPTNAAPTSTVRTVKPTGTQRFPMGSLRKTALIAGALYLLTFVASIPARILISPMLDNPDYIVSSGSDTPVLWGNVLDVITALAGIGTAIVLFRVVKRQNEALALGFVASRVLEAALILVGVVSLLSVVTLRQQLAGTSGADAASIAATGRSLVATHDWAYLLGPALMAGLNALLLGSMMYRSRLVPRIIPILGLIGAPLIIASALATVFGIYPQFSVWGGIATIPIFLWELSLGVYLVVKGFRSCPITAEMTTATPPTNHNVTA